MWEDLTLYEKLMWKEVWRYATKNRHISPKILFSECIDAYIKCYTRWKSGEWVNKTEMDFKKLLQISCRHKLYDYIVNYVRRKNPTHRKNKNHKKFVIEQKANIASNFTYDSLRQVKDVEEKEMFFYSSEAIDIITENNRDEVFFSITDANRAFRDGNRSWQRVYNKFFFNELISLLKGTGSEELLTSIISEIEEIEASVSKRKPCVIRKRKVNRQDIQYYFVSIKGWEKKKFSKCFKEIEKVYHLIKS